MDTPDKKRFECTAMGGGAEEAKGGVQVIVRVSVEVEGVEKPACVADTVSRFLP